MPVYLPPVSRRRFLKGSAAAVAALALGQGCVTTPRRESRVAFLSDIHIAADPRKVARNINMTDNLKAVTGEILAWPQKPDVVFINGDLAFNEGNEADYAAVLQLVHPLREAGLPIHVEVGNHDDRGHLWSVLRNERTVPRDLPGRQAAVIPDGPVNWFLLDSLIKTLTTPGKLGEAQLAWLTKQLDARPDKPAIVMIHHQPGPMSATHPGGGLEDADQLFAVLRPRRQVKAYIFGHTHHWQTREDESGIHLINLPTTAYVFEEGQANGWVTATVRGDGIALEMRALDKSHKAHGQKIDLTWRA